MKNKGFTLIELLTVLAIVALLGSIAIPWYGQYTQRGNRGEGISSLQDILNAQERFYTDNVTYTTNLANAGLPSDPFVTTRGFYSISARQCTQGGANLPLTQCVELVATAINGQVPDGNLITNTLGRQDRILPDNSVVGWK